MDFFQLEELLFAETGACMNENERESAKKYKQACELLKTIDSTGFNLNEYLNFVNIFIRFTVCSVSSFHEIKESAEMLALMYQKMIDSPFYEEKEM